MLWHGKNFRGIINKAKEMIFDNTGTDLISTNAEDAIKEVNGKLVKTKKVTITGENTASQVPFTVLAYADNVLNNGETFVSATLAGDNNYAPLVSSPDFSTTANKLFIYGNSSLQSLFYFIVAYI